MGWWAATGIWMLCGLLKSSVACGRTILGFLGVRKSRDWNLFRVHWTLDTETGRALARPSAWRRIAVLSHVGGRAAAWWGQRKEGYVWGLQGPELGSCLPRCGCGDCCDATIGLAWLSSPLSEPSGPVRVRRQWVTKKQQSNSRALTFNHTWPVNYHICKSYLGLRIPTTVHMPIDKWELKGKHIWNHLSFLEDITVSKEFETLWNWTESTERNWTMSLIYKIETYFTLFQK